MAIKGLSFGERNEFISADDPSITEEDGATVFYWTALPSRIHAKLADQQNSHSLSLTENAQTLNSKINQRNRDAFRFGVIGWKTSRTTRASPSSTKWLRSWSSGRPSRLFPKTA